MYLPSIKLIVSYWIGHSVWNQYSPVVDLPLSSLQGEFDSKWINPLDTSTLNPYTLCGRLNLNVAQRVCVFQIEYLNVPIWHMKDRMIMTYKICNDLVGIHVDPYISTQQGQRMSKLVTEPRGIWCKCILWRTSTKLIFFHTKGFKGMEPTDNWNKRGLIAESLQECHQKYHSH